MLERPTYHEVSDGFISIFPGPTKKLKYIREEIQGKTKYKKGEH